LLFWTKPVHSASLLAETRSTETIAKRFMPFISYAQNYEDVMLWRALGEIEKGFYVDVGAADPEELSVTRAFYDRGWSGINIEPLEEYYNKLALARPRDTNLKIAAGREAGLHVLHAFAGTGLSTFSQEIAAEHRAAGRPSCETIVPVLPLASILESCESPVIHFLKIDVEGAESEVLAGLNLQRARPWIILVEATKPFSKTSTRSDWEQLVTGQGYDFAYFDGLNCFYTANEIPGLKERFATPPNFFDDFVRWEEWSGRQTAEKLKQEQDRALELEAALLNATTEAEALRQLSELRFSEAANLRNAWQAEQAQSASLRNAWQAEQAQSASLRNGWQAEQAQNVVLRNALQAEQARANFSMGRIHQLEAQVAAPSVDRFLGRILTRLRESGDRLTGGGLRSLIERLATLLRRTFSRFTRHQRLPVSGGAVTSPGAGVLTKGANRSGRTGEIKEHDNVSLSAEPEESSFSQELESFSSLFDFATFEIGSALYSFDLATLNARSVKIIESDGRHQVLELVPGQTRRVEVPFPAGKAWNTIRFETETEGVQQGDGHTLFFSVDLDAAEATIRMPSETLKPVCGFSDIEVDGKACHVWAIAEQAELDVLNIAEGTDPAVYSFDITTLDARSIKVTPPEGHPQTLNFLSGQSQRIKVCLTGGRQGSKVKFETGPEGVTPPGDERTLFFKVDLHTVLTRIAVPRQTLEQARGFIEIKDARNASLLWAIARQADLKVLDILCHNRAVALPPSARPIYLRLRNTVFNSTLWNRAR
jgi:FkbM family methyltransferase